MDTQQIVVDVQYMVKDSFTAFGQTYDKGQVLPLSHFKSWIRRMDADGTVTRQGLPTSTDVSHAVRARILNGFLEPYQEENFFEDLADAEDPLTRTINAAISDDVPVSTAPSTPAPAPNAVGGNTVSNVPVGTAGSGFKLPGN